jgi:hypothetical protein
MGEGWVMDKLVRISLKREELHYYSAPEGRISPNFWVPQAVRPQHSTPA